MTNSEFIEVAEIDGVAIVRFYDLNEVVSGIGMDQIEGLEAELLAVVDQDPLAVILDFEEKDFIPAATIECVFVKLYTRLKARLKMCNLPAMVMEQFEMNRLATLFHIHTALDDALASVNKADFET